MGKKKNTSGTCRWLHWRCKLPSPKLNHTSFPKHSWSNCSVQAKHTRMPTHAAPRQCHRFFFFPHSGQFSSAVPHKGITKRVTTKELSVVWREGSARKSVSDEPDGSLRRYPTSKRKTSENKKHSLHCCTAHSHAHTDTFSVHCGQHCTRHFLYTLTPNERQGERTSRIPRR